MVEGKVNPKQRWKDAIDKFRPAIALEQYDSGALDSLIDSVRVGIVQTLKKIK